LAGKSNHRGWGYVRKLPSKRYQASYVGPDLQRHTAPATFAAKLDAEAWLAARYREITTDTWASSGPAPVKALTLAEYATPWLAGRELKPRTKEHYARLLDTHILPTLGEVALPQITPSRVRAWHAATSVNKPTMRAHAYSLLRTVLNTAAADDLITSNPCRVRGAGSSKRVHEVRPASLLEIAALVEAMPQRLQVMTLLAAWCGLRFGELAELRRRDVDQSAGVLRVRRGVVLVAGEPVVGTPKSVAGIRDVAVPPHLLPALQDHLEEHAQGGREGLLFPALGGGHLSPTGLYSVFYPAREKAGRPDLRWHDLRHTGAVLAASTGATLAELMARLGHSTLHTPGRDALPARSQGTGRADRSCAVSVGRGNGAVNRKTRRIVRHAAGVMNITRD